MKVVIEAIGNVCHSNLPGVKGWTIGSSSGIISSGHAQLDKLIGGGFILGTICLQELESYSDYGKTLTMYSVAEAISTRQKSIVVLQNEREKEIFISNIPRNINLSNHLEEGVVPNEIPVSFCNSFDLSRRSLPLISAEINAIFRS